MNRFSKAFVVFCGLVGFGLGGCAVDNSGGPEFVSPLSMVNKFLHSEDSEVDAGLRKELAANPDSVKYWKEGVVSKGAKEVVDAVRRGDRQMDAAALEEIRAADLTVLEDRISSLEEDIRLNHGVLVSNSASDKGRDAKHQRDEDIRVLKPLVALWHTTREASLGDLNDESGYVTCYDVNVLLGKYADSAPPVNVPTVVNGSILASR